MVQGAQNRSDHRFRIGCAGWGLSSRVAASFPTEGTHLQRYAAVFNSVEIDSSFYRSHRPSTYARWRDSVPADFRFSVKLPRTITHERRLCDVDELLEAFLDEVGELGDTLGCLLVQLPPSLSFDAGNAGAFFSLLRASSRCALTCEPRHASWFDDAAAQVMREHQVTCVEADPPSVAGATPRGHDALSYIRLHGSPEIYRSAYSDAFIDDLARRLLAGRNGPVDAPAWVIFDNTALGEAQPNALALRARLHSGG